MTDTFIVLEIEYNHRIDDDGSTFIDSEIVDVNTANDGYLTSACAHQFSSEEKAQKWIDAERKRLKNKEIHNYEWQIVKLEPSKQKLPRYID